MALEVDALVRSIEDEKIDEEAREKVSCEQRKLIHWNKANIAPSTDP